LETECATFATARWPPDTLREPQRVGCDASDGRVCCSQRPNDASASLIDWRAAFPIVAIPHGLLTNFSDMIRARTFAISCGYEDADDLDFLRTDPAFKLACGKLPDTGSDCVRSRRRTLFPADPYLRHREKPPCRRHPAARQDAVRRRGARSSAAPAVCSWAMDITRGPRRWRGVRRTAPAVSSAFPAQSRCRERRCREGLRRDATSSQILGSWSIIASARQY
jgi:hypothetical protein